MEHHHHIDHTNLIYFNDMSKLQSKATILSYFQVSYSLRSIPNYIWLGFSTFWLTFVIG